MGLVKHGEHKQAMASWDQPSSPAWALGSHGLHIMHRQDTRMPVDWGKTIVKCRLPVEERFLGTVLFLTVAE